MMGMKQLGVRDVNSLRSRAFRLLALERISKDAAEEISQRCDDLQLFIENMEETDGKARRNTAARSTRIAS